MGLGEPIFSQSKLNLLAYFSRSTGLRIVYPTAIDFDRVMTTTPQRRSTDRSMPSLSMVRRHRPQVMKIDRQFVPAGFVAIVFGAPGTPSNDEMSNESSSYESVTLIKKLNGLPSGSRFAKDSPQSVTSAFDPDVNAPIGRSVFLVSLPPNVEIGEVVRVVVRCKVTGEYEFECAII